MGGIATRLGRFGAALAGLALSAGAGPARAQVSAPAKPGHAVSALPSAPVAHGVIKPPRGIDPGIHAAPPETGTMPVIPPPGTAGGGRDVIPK